ncbi:hypothetical protein B0H11DRAFT_2182950 [Mycena galericulata]|nr:hypothetical protein B0H11DRAFT_2182950 [Mycena galericulata]
MQGPTKLTVLVVARTSEKDTRSIARLLNLRLCVVVVREAFGREFPLRTPLRDLSSVEVLREGLRASVGHTFRLLNSIEPLNHMLSFTQVAHADDPPYACGSGSCIGCGWLVTQGDMRAESKCKRREDPMQPTVQLHPSRLQNHGGSEQTGKPVSSACDSAASSEHAMKVAWKGQGRNGGTNTTGKPDSELNMVKNIRPARMRQFPNVSTNVRLCLIILQIFEGITATMSWRVLRVVRGRCQLSRSWLTRAGACLVYPDTPNAWIAVRDSKEYGRERPKVEV